MPSSPKATVIALVQTIGAALKHWRVKRSKKRADAEARQRYRALMEDKRRVGWWHF